MFSLWPKLQVIYCSSNGKRIWANYLTSIYPEIIRKSIFKSIFSDDFRGNKKSVSQICLILDAKFADDH